MFDKAKIWVSNYLSARKQVDWGEFVIDLSARFRDEIGHDIVEQFNKLQQVNSLEAYIDDFENLRSLLLQNNHTLPEDYILECFVGGLKPAVKPFVRAFKPTTVADAILYARLQEESLNNVQKNSKPNFSSSITKPIFSTVTKTPILPTPQLKPVSQGFNKENQKPFKFIPAEVRAEKMTKGLCYYCDKKYERGHKCQFKEAQLFTVEIPCEEEVLVEEEVVEAVYNEYSSEPCISVNALMGSHTFNTMRVQGWVQGKPIHILIDSGSTHNFLDIRTAQKLGCKKEGIGLQAVTVADGNHIPCQHVVKKFCWKLGGSTFTVDTLLIELGSCDMVLGIQWLSTLGNISWDFQRLVMEFVFDDQVVKLKCIASQKLKVLKGQPSIKLLQNSTQLCLLQLRQVDDSSSAKELWQLEGSQETPIPDNATAGIHTKLVVLKEQYKDIFKEPEKLPPVRELFDHRIPLEVGANPVSIRPYRYPLKQRDIIENIIEEMPSLRVF